MAALMAGAGLAGMATAASAQEDKKLLIGLSLPTQLQPRWLFDSAAFAAQAKANGDEVIVLYADADPSKQTQQVQTMISRGVDVLVLGPTDAAVGATLIDAAKDEGIKTIIYDLGIKGSAADWMIARNEAQVGELQVDAALAFAPTGNYAVLKGDAAFDLAQTNSAVYQKRLADAKGVNVVYNDFIPGWDPATAQRTAEDILTRNRDDVVAFLANNDGIATGIVQSLRGAGINGKVFVSGLDGDEANLHLIASGDQTMTVFTPIDEMGRLAADAAHDLGNDRVPPSNQTYATDKGDVPMHAVSLVSVNKENLCDFVTNIAPEGWANPAVVFQNTDVTCP